jgi:hypothetical protein
MIDDNLGEEVTPVLWRIRTIGGLQAFKGVYPVLGALQAY